jgi:gluconolactonase
MTDTEMSDPSAESFSRIRKLRREIDEIIPPNAKAEKLASGFGFTEGPVWTREEFLLFSDIPNNVIFKWDPKFGVSESLTSSGYDGSDIAPGAHIGSNGLTLDREGRLIICEHGNRRLTRLEADHRRTVLADRFLGKRLNSPNDVVCKSNGSIYFTDPPYGLPRRDADPNKQLSFNGVFCLVEGHLQLVYDGLTRPNGLAFSPDEEYLYVSNSDRSRMIWMRFDVGPDGRLSNPEVFCDATQESAEGLPDGLKLDRLGNLYCTGPGGIWIFSPAGNHLGTIELPEVPANCNWGDDGRNLYITARTSLYRIRLLIEGIRP